MTWGSQCDLLLQKMYCSFSTLRINGVMHPLAFFAALDNAGITEDLHVVGEGGLCNMEVIQKHTGTFLATAKQLQNTQTVFIAERFEYSCGINIFRCHPIHLTFMFFDLSILYSSNRKLSMCYAEKFPAATPFLSNSRGIFC